MDNKILLVLDIDETLLHSSERKLDRKEDYFYYEFDKFGEVEFFVYKRPHWDALKKVIEENDNIEYGFYSNSMKNYCNELADWLSEDMNKRPLFTFDRSRVTNKVESSSSLYDSFSSSRSLVIKDLKKVARNTDIPVKNMICLDDKPVYPRQYGNLVKISEYRGDTNDTELKSFSKRLEKLAKTFDGVDIRNNLKKVSKKTSFDLNF